APVARIRWSKHEGFSITADSPASSLQPLEKTSTCDTVGSISSGTSTAGPDDRVGTPPLAVPDTAVSSAPEYLRIWVVLSFAIELRRWRSNPLPYRNFCLVESRRRGPRREQTAR